ncbi:hypothetical protein TI39_contig4146g00004 [Zymoseptoria brevis]|uniref:Heterokaryon incompatibility domain-containing protein n=1 Tax=Zymoseptoria brevis TaxID=1047168 RepID=A0A0F4GC58_9PEZI|nr:hypothetical protein TI39_contig4146g00004 [Zymoseptoria brevis]
MAVLAKRPWELADRVQIQTIGLPKLQDLSKEIRLLHMQHGFNDDPIVCDYVVHHLAKERKYFAMSYTWGDPAPTRGIEVAGQTVRVHENCFQALRQARNYCLPTVQIKDLWIDAICIDQSNPVEKSLQVQSMSSIFGRAHVVAVYLGLDETTIDALFRNLRSLDHLAKDSRIAQPDEVIELGMGCMSAREEYINHAWPKFYPARKKSLARCYTEMSNRPYWSQLWIVPELSAAGKIEIMCGFASYDWTWLNGFRIERHLKLTHLTPMRRATPMIVRGAIVSHAWAGGTTLPLQQLTGKLERYRFLLCSDRRDRIYAVLSMLPRPRGLPPLEVDYEKSAVQLAKDFICHFSQNDDDVDYVTLSSLASATALLLEGLQITSSDIRSQLEWPQTCSSQDHLEVHDSVTVLVLYEYAAYHNIANLEPHCGRFTLTSTHAQFKHDLWPWLDQFPELPECSSCNWVNNQVVAVTCPGTQNGDLLIPLYMGDLTSTWPFGLVLRRTSDEAYAPWTRSLRHHEVGRPQL